MKPGERVKLIEEAADSLAGRDFTKAQMILEQFGIETYDIDELHWLVGTIGGGTHIRGEGFQRPVPQVVGLPPLHSTGPGSTPPCSIAAARSANLLLWC